jgi:hypothetical protein
LICGQSINDSDPKLVSHCLVLNRASGKHHSDSHFNVYDDWFFPKCAILLRAGFSGFFTRIILVGYITSMRVKERDECVWEHLHWVSPCFKHLLHKPQNQLLHSIVRGVENMTKIARVPWYNSENQFVSTRYNP